MSTDELTDESDLNLERELDPSYYVGDSAPTLDTTRTIQEWLTQKRETTRTDLSMLLAKALVCFLAVTFILMSVAAFSPAADKAFIKDIIPLVITPQVTLIGVALGFYFGTKSD